MHAANNSLNISNIIFPEKDSTTDSSSWEKYRFTLTVYFLLWGMRGWVITLTVHNISDEKMNSVWKGRTAIENKVTWKMWALKTCSNAPRTSPPPPPSPPFLTVYRIGTPYEVFQFIFFVFFRFAFFQVFTGNSDQTSIVKHSLRNHFKARYVRFYPVTYIHWSCLRVEIFELK